MGSQPPPGTRMVQGLVVFKTSYGTKPWIGGHPYTLS